MRSTYTNTLIKRALEVADIVEVYDGEEDFECDSFKQVAEVVDSVDEVTLTLYKRDPVTFERKHLGCFYIMLENEDEEQLSDHSDNEFSCQLVQFVNEKRDIHAATVTYY